MFPDAKDQILEFKVHGLKIATFVAIFSMTRNSLKVLGKDKTFHSTIINFAGRWVASFLTSPSATENDLTAVDF